MMHVCAPLIMVGLFLVPSIVCDPTPTPTPSPALGYPPMGNLPSLHLAAFNEWTYATANLRSLENNEPYGIYGVSNYLPLTQPPIPIHVNQSSNHGYTTHSIGCSQIPSQAILSIVTHHSYVSATEPGVDTYCSAPTTWSSTTSRPRFYSALNWVSAATPGTAYGARGNVYEWRGQMGNISFFLAGVDITGVDLHNDAGMSSGPGYGFTDYYYSLHIEVDGYIQIGSKIDLVHGYIWMDHEWEIAPTIPNEKVTPEGIEAPTLYSSSLSPAQQAALHASEVIRGWTWSGGHYRNTTDGHTYFLMWNRLRATGATPYYIKYDGFELMRAGGTVQQYTHPTHVTVTQVWTSPYTNRTYPIGVEVTFDGWGTLTYHPVYTNQEIVSQGTPIWEGLCHVTCSRHDVADFDAYLEYLMFQ